MPKEPSTVERLDPNFTCSALLLYCEHYIDRIYIRTNVLSGRFETVPLSKLPAVDALRWLIHWWTNQQIPIIVE